MFEKSMKNLFMVFLTLILISGTLQGMDTLKAYAADPVDSWSNHIEEPSETGSVYTIEKEEHLAWVASQVNSGSNIFSGCTLEVNSNLDLSKYYWVPIGNSSYAFKGTVNGNNKVISGLKIGSSSSPDATIRYAGLFGNVNAAMITNVCLENIAIYTSYGSSSSTPRIGGIVGCMNGNSTLSGCRATGTLYSNGEYATIGGMLGYFDGQNSESLTIKNCYSQCVISGTRLLYIGCLAGSIVGKTKSPAYKIIIKNCFATGAVVGGYYGTTYIGGLAGNCQYVKIYNSYSNCIIKGKSGYFGGFAGYGKYSAFLNDYAAGSTSAPYSAGGFIGLKYGSGNTLSNCYWNSSGAAYGIGNNTDTGTEKRDDMQLSSFRDKLNSNGAALKVSESDPDIVTWVQTADKNGGYPRLEDIGAFTTVYEPILSDVAISGEARIEKTLTIGYTYTDMNGYPDSGTTFQWYRSANPDGSGGVQIAGATQKTYTLTSDDVAKYIYAVVAPSNGFAAGTAVTSGCTSQVDGPYFAGGSGISSDPYKIKTLAQLKNVTVFADIYHYYDLENDIEGLDEVLGGVTNKVFTGDFNGNGHTVTLAITDQPDSYWYVGMFGTIGKNGYIHDLNIAGSVTESVYGPQAVGSLVGLNQGTLSNCNSSAAVTITGGSATSARLGGLAGDNSGSITNCSVTGTVGAINQIGKTNSIAMIGGIAGNNYNLLSPGLITGCHADIHSFSVDLASFNEVHAGGLVGLNEKGSTITNSYTDHGLQCSLTPEKETSIVRIGGIAGYNYGANISKCYATGDVTGNGNCNVYSGGLVGQCGFEYPFTYSNISESFYSGTVAGRGGSSKDTRVGGLVGYFDSGNISYCYSSGSVNGDGGGIGTGNVYSGGLIGYNYKGGVDHCYTRSSGTATGGGTNYNGGLYGRSQTYSPTCYWNKESTTANYGEAVSSSSIPGTTMATTQMTGANVSSSMLGLDFTTPYFVAKDSQSEYWYYPQLNVFASSADGKVRDASLQSVTSVVYASVITIADIPGITPPAIAQLPTYKTETAQYTGSICWSPNGIPFSADTVYSAKITLIPKAGYTLDGVSKNFFKVAGADSTSNSANSGVVTAVFPATAKIKNAIIKPTGAVFNLLSPNDVSTLITDWGDAATVTGVVYGANPLSSPGDFIVNGNNLTITKGYLSGLNLSNGNTVGLEVSFDVGASATLTIEARQNYVPGTDASLSDLKVGGTTVSGFGAGKYEYTIELPAATQPGSGAAMVTALPNDPKATVNITQAAALPGAATVLVTSEDKQTMQTYTIDFTLAGAAISDYALTITAGTGGSITAGSNGNYAAGTVIDIAAAANANYRFNIWTSTNGGTFANANSAGTTFTMPAANTAITASFTYNGSGGGGRSSSGSTNSPSSYHAVVSGNNLTEYSLPVDVDASTASVDIGKISGDIFAGAANTVIAVPHISKVNSYTIKIPVPSLLSPKREGAVIWSTEIGNITIPDNMLTGISGIEGKEAAITIGSGDKASLSEDVKEAIGGKPLVQLTLAVDGKPVEWNNPNAPVTITIPYKPTESELANPEAIVVWYIDGKGNVVCIPNGHYDPANGTVTFSTTHFSHYALGYNKVSFRDVPESAWYGKAVGFIAARGIAAGTGGGNYSPAARLTRGEFLVMMLKAYEIKPDTDTRDNFADAGSTYYTSYLATARSMNITGGIGNNRFAPDREITRQEMFTMLYNFLKAGGKLPSGNTEQSLAGFSDAGNMASWAQEAMTLMVGNGIIKGSNGELAPAGLTTRAEMAQVLYNLLLK